MAANIQDGRHNLNILLVMIFHEYGSKIHVLGKLVQLGANTRTCNCKFILFVRDNPIWLPRTKMAAKILFIKIIRLNIAIF